MFDTIKVGGGDHYHSHKISVTEFRAPTDESVRILHDFEEKARKNVVGHWRLDQNEIRAIAVAFQVDNLSDMIVVYVKFELNGKKYEFREEVRRDKFLAEEFVLNGEAVPMILLELFVLKVSTALFGKSLDGLKNREAWRYF